MTLQAKQLELVPHEPSATNKRTQGGISTADVVMSAFTGGNADIFPQILELHVPDGAKIADVTYGTGVFWKNVDLSRYELIPSDVATGVDCRALPYATESLDAVVLDPPYMEGLLRPNKEHKACGEVWQCKSTKKRVGKGAIFAHLPTCPLAPSLFMATAPGRWRCRAPAADRACPALVGASRAAACPQTRPALSGARLPDRRSVTRGNAGRQLMPHNA